MSNLKLITTITIPQYIRRALMSKARKKRYYERGKKKPPDKFYRNIDKYSWLEFPNGKEYLVERATKERVIANPRTAGSEKWKVINGQKIYSGQIARWDKEKMMTQIRESYIPFLEEVDPITEFPLRILAELHDTYRDVNPTDPDWDIDNRFYPYGKAFPDVLMGWPKWVKGVIEYQTRILIPEDHRGYITQPPTPLFCPIEDSENRKIVFKIYQDLRPEILVHYAYNEKCMDCKGKGKWTEPIVGEVTCPTCKGEGKRDNRIKIK